MFTVASPRLPCDQNVVLDQCAVDCNTNGVPDECELLANDCNENGIPDDCDITAGTSDDDNENGIPDECERVPFDADGDMCITLADFVAGPNGFAPCLAGPGVPVADECRIHDSDDDLDVDVADFMAFVRAFTGPDCH